MPPEEKAPPAPKKKKNAAFWRWNKINLIYIYDTMSNNKLVKSVLDAATITGLAAGIGWIAKKTVKETFTADPSSNVMNYVKFTAVMAGSIAPKQTPRG